MARQSPYRGRRPWQRGPRRNERIRAREVRVIGPKGDQIGVMATEQAIKLAREAGMDLVEISANARPPVCRILDFGKYMYEQSKRTKENKSASSRIKEVKFRVKTDEHDYMTKLRRAEDFLAKGHKVKLTLTFRGRENEHRDLGFNNINRAVEDLKGVGSLDSPARLAGRNINAMISPLPANQRKVRWNRPDDEAPAAPASPIAEDEDDE